MQIAKPVLVAIVLALAVLTLGTNPVWAARVDCVFAACGFTTGVGGSIVTNLSTAGWQGTVTSEAVNDTGGTFSYLFEFLVTATGGGNTTAGTAISPIFHFTTASPGPVNLFDSGLNFGVITDKTSGVTPGSVAFFFEVSRLLVTPPGDPSQVDVVGDRLTFYARSTIPPGHGSFSAINGGVDQGGSVDPVPVPEPTSMLLLGSGLVLVGTAIRRRRSKLD